MTGFAVVIPLGLTVFILKTLFNWMDSFLAPFLASLLGAHVPGLGIILTAALVYLVGLTTANVLGRRLLSIGEALLLKLPIVRSIYGPSKQVVATMTSPGAQVGKRVVLVEYPVRGIMSVGLVTGEVPGSDDEPSRLCVFVPTTPNPTSGMIVVLRSDQVQPVDITVEEALRLVVSGGIVAPPGLRWEDRRDG